MRFVIAGIALVLVAGGVLGGTYWSGSIVEKQYGRAWDEIGREAALELESREYDRGLRTSVARTEFAVRGETLDEFVPDASESGMERLVLVVEDTIHHGPVLFGGDGAFGAARIESVLRFAEETRAALPWLPDDGSLITADTYVDFEGNSTIRYQSPEVDQESEGGRFSSSGLRGTLRLNAAFDKQAADMTLERLVLDAPGNGTFTLEDVYLEADGRALSDHVWVGTTDLRVGAFVVETPVDALELRGVTGRWTLDEEEGLLGAELTADVERFHLLEDGSADTFEYMRFHLTSANLDAEVIEQLIAWADSVNRGRMGDNEYAMRSMSVFPDLLAHNPRLSLDELYVETPEGVVTGSVSAEWTGGAPEMNNPFAMLNGLVVDFSLSGPEKWWGVALGGMEDGGPAAGASSSGTVRQLMDQGLMVRDDGDLRLEFSLRDGMIHADGKPLGSVLQFLGGM